MHQLARGGIGNGAATVAHAKHERRCAQGHADADAGFTQLFVAGIVDEVISHAVK